MKKLICMVMSLCLLLSLSACVNEQPGQTESSSNPAETTSAAASVLDVYYLKGHTVSEQILNYFVSDTVTIHAVGFDDIEAMDLQIAAEIGTGKGPDVILFPSTTTLDTEKMARNGAFLDLSSMLEEEKTEEQYYTAVLSAGNIGGKQLLMPLRFRLLSLITSQEALAEMGLSPSDIDTVPEMVNVLTQKAADYPAEEAAVLVNYPAGSGFGLLYDNLRLSGLQVADLENQSLGVSKELFQSIAQYTKMQWQELADFQPVWSKYIGSDLTEVFTRARIQVRGYSMFQDLRYYHSFYDQALGQTMTFITYPNYEDPAGITADVLLYAAVLGNTDQEEAARSFVRSAMDTPIRDIGDDLSVSRQWTDYLLDKVSRWDGNTMSIGASKSITVEKMSEELRNSCEAVLERITSASIRNGAVSAVLAETMEAYITGEASFEACYTKFENQLGIYLYE